MDVVRKELEGQIQRHRGAGSQLAGDSSRCPTLAAKRWVLFGQGRPEFAINPDTGQPMKGHRLKSQTQALSVTP